MTEPPMKEHLPTPEDLEREARRLARVRHLSVVSDRRIDPPPEPRLLSVHEFDPGPKEAA